MNPEIVEVMEPEKLEVYKRWSPRFTTLDHVALGMSVVALVLALLDSGRALEWLFGSLLGLSVAIRLAVYASERTMLPRISGSNPDFLSPPFMRRARGLSAGVHAVLVIACYVAAMSVYDWPII